MEVQRKGSHHLLGTDDPMEVAKGQDSYVEDASMGHPSSYAQTFCALLGEGSRKLQIYHVRPKTGLTSNENLVTLAF